MSLKRSTEISTNQLQNAKESINVPPLIGREPLGRKTDLSSHAKLKLIVRNFQEG